MRLLRGRVVVRELHEKHGPLWTPRPGGRDIKTHRGVVLGLGPPALTKRGHEVPHGFVVGDVVGFHFLHNESMATNLWTDGKEALWMAQNEIDWVLEHGE